MTITPIHVQRMLGILHQYQGLEVRCQQLVTEFQVSVAPQAKPEDVAAVLASLKDSGHAVRRIDDLRGPVWRITPDGAAEARKLDYESQF